ncbi:MAG TPA: ORF6N domain-containing protein [Steroidobacteraceae bacterium]|nr:ORF6N domain-containing protein [Steroidobacteraceae bacterium]
MRSYFSDTRALAPVEDITRSILVLRGHRVLLDVELAVLYGVPTKALNQAVKRNTERFPEDFVFRLTRADQHHDEAITAILSAIRELTNPPQPKGRGIGFTVNIE